MGDVNTLSGHVMSIFERIFAGQHGGLHLVASDLMPPAPETIGVEGDLRIIPSMDVIVYRPFSLQFLDPRVYGSMCFRCLCLLLL